MSNPPPYPAYPPQPQPYPPPQMHYPPAPGPPSTYPATQGPYQPYTGPSHTYGYQGSVPPPPQNVVYTDRTVVYVEDRHRHRSDDTAEKCCLLAMCALCLCCLLDD
ncbi:hypothetical protein HOLleu_37226 [Holothuria leucospilota]|uniref:Cysteine-rich and transmembrane domain-containing protein 1 n=1 Tax=Holothuria leucospilota TaxID=206669 RepID=A0A9Q1BEL5_HOLLE|nr:hypothetical protein HOLleu_37226 [Holothuria leucospilota]